MVPWIEAYLVPRLINSCCIASWVVHTDNPNLRLVLLDSGGSVQQIDISSHIDLGMRTFISRSKCGFEGGREGQESEIIQHIATLEFPQSCMPPSPGRNNNRIMLV